MQVRRNPGLVCQWGVGGLEVGAPESAARCRIPWKIAEMLDAVADWTEVTDAFLQLWAPIGRGELDLLVEQGVLQEPSELAENQWGHWGPIATNFHAVSRNAHYPESPEARQALAEEISADSGDDEIFKQYRQAPTVPLPRAFSSLGRPYGEVLTARRTHRTFTPEPVRLDDLATSCITHLARSALLMLGFSAPCSSNAVHRREAGTKKSVTSTSAGFKESSQDCTTTMPCTTRSR